MLTPTLAKKHRSLPPGGALSPAGPTLPPDSTPTLTKNHRSLPPGGALLAAWDRPPDSPPSKKTPSSPPPAANPRMKAPRPYIPEAVDPEAVSPSAPFRAVKQFGLVLLCAAWVVLGIAGHDPWKTEDATSIGVAVEMAERNDFVVPTLGGEPYLPHPPLAYMGGAASLRLLSPPLTAHNAARVIAGIALALILLATAYASRELNGRAFRWLPVLILVGSVGFWDRAHVLSPELFLTLGVAVGLWGFALALRRPVLGGWRLARVLQSRSWATASWVPSGSP